MRSCITKANANYSACNTLTVKKKRKYNITETFASDIISVKSYVHLDRCLNGRRRWHNQAELQRERKHVNQI
jgi:hypothetical protein